MSEAFKKIWLAAKSYGVGWGLPLCWQGWVVYVIYMALLFGGIFELLVKRKWHPGSIRFICDRSVPGFDRNLLV